MGDFSFNLIDEAWIPCLMISGDRKVMGLRDVLCQAHCIESFELQNPLEEAVLYRLLLALVHRIVDGPRNAGEWRSLYTADSLDQTKVAKYLNSWHHRFDLFSKDAPFFQTAGLQVQDKEKKPIPIPVTVLQLSKASGNNKTLFNHSRDKDVIPISPIEATFTLLASQGYLFSGKNKKTTNHFGYQEGFRHGSMVTGLFCMLHGKNLYQTLILNLLVLGSSDPVPTTNEDGPIWERNEREGTLDRAPRGYLDFLTCKSRHIRLVPQYNDEGNVVVSKAHIAQGESFQSARNPFGIFTKNRDGDLQPIQLDMDRALWRDSTALFAFSLEADERPKAFRQVGNALAKRFVSKADRYRCLVYGLANGKANPLAWRKEILHFPTELLSEKEVVDRLRFGLGLVEKGGEILECAAKLYVRNCLPKNPKKADVKVGVTASGVMPLYWDRIEHPYREFMENIDCGGEPLIRLKQSIKYCAGKAFKVGFEHRFTSSGKTYRAWAHGSGTLDRGLAKLLETEGGNK